MFVSVVRPVKMTFNVSGFLVWCSCTQSPVSCRAGLQAQYGDINTVMVASRYQAGNNKAGNEGTTLVTIHSVFLLFIPGHNKLENTRKVLE